LQREFAISGKTVSISTLMQVRWSNRTEASAATVLALIFRSRFETPEELSQMDWFIWAKAFGVSRSGTGEIVMLL
jgi:hypothetical protein